MIEITWGGAFFLWFWITVIAFSVSFAVNAAKNLLDNLGR